MKINKDKAKQYIYKTNGKIFSAVFTKKDGEKRKMVCRRGVSKYVTNTLEQITVQGITYTIKESK